MPRRRRGNPNRTDQQNNDQRDNSQSPANSRPPQGSTPRQGAPRRRGNPNASRQGQGPRPQNQPPQASGGPTRGAPAQAKNNPRGNRPPRRRFPPAGNPSPNENTPAQPNRGSQRRQPSQRTTPGKEKFTFQPNRPSPRRTFSPGKVEEEEDYTPRRSSFSRRNADQRRSFFERPAPSVPIRTNRGIKARSQRGQFSQHWWARRWIEAMEGLVDPARLSRGRSYARTGQVLSINETQNGIEARVQGSRPQPYKVTIQVSPLSDEQWDQVIDALSEQALFTAQLLAGEMPGNIEDAFNTAGVSLFPSQTGDLTSDCTCPDWANPCKHVAATHYILGDRFDDDPFLLFRMRGRSQEQILEALRARRSEAGRSEAGEPEPETVEAEVAPAETVEPLEESLERFWEPVDSLDSFPLTIKLASVDMPLLKRLGEPAFLSGASLQALLKPVYDYFTRSALKAAYTEEEPIESGNGNGNGSGNGLD